MKLHFLFRVLFEFLPKAEFVRKLWHSRLNPTLCHFGAYSQRKEYRAHRKPQKWPLGTFVVKQLGIREISNQIYCTLFEDNEILYRVIILHFWSQKPNNQFKNSFKIQCSEWQNLASLLQKMKVQVLFCQRDSVLIGLMTL